MATKSFDDGSLVTFNDKGQVIAVSCGGCADKVFSEDKSLKQLYLDIQHYNTMQELCPPKKEEIKEEKASE